MTKILIEKWINKISGSIYQCSSPSVLSDDYRISSNYELIHQEEIERPEVSKQAREFYLSDKNYLNKCKDMHVYSNKPIWADDAIHVREVIPGEAIVKREQLANIFLSNHCTLHKGGLFDSICKGIGLDEK